MREVAEETGIIGRMLASLGTIDYWFFTSKTRVHKVVHQCLLEATGGELTIEGDPPCRGHRRGVVPAAGRPHAPHLCQ